MAGDVIAGKYQLARVLGQGGMGSVWLAHNLALDADVAIKLIRRDLAAPEAAQRLLQEARAAARLGHPSIVRVFDFGATEQHDPFIVMEVLKGESLGQAILRKRKLSPLSAVRVLLPVASALSAAHGKGIIHRDLKPDNVLLARDDSGVVVPKVVDFGIAKLHHEDAHGRATTQAGTIMGSPRYMSPEQACGRTDIDHHTDIWSLCVMLYEAVTGAAPFDGPNYNALLCAVMLGEPRSLPDLGVHDEELWAIVARGLAKEPQDRWQSMRELGAELARWALLRGGETDAAGNSLKAHWLRGAEHTSLSDMPPSSASAKAAVRPPLLPEPPPLDPPPDDAPPESGPRTRGATSSPAAERHTPPTSGASPLATTVPVVPIAPPVPTPLPPPPRKGRSAAWWIVRAGIAAASIGVGIYLGRAPAPPAETQGVVALSTPPAEDHAPIVAPLPAPEDSARPAQDAPAPEPSAARRPSVDGRPPAAQATPSPSPRQRIPNRRRGSAMPVPEEPYF